eukprot:9491384-Lingulodinium_polyedra.AAC.1
MSITPIACQSNVKDVPASLAQPVFATSLAQCIRLDANSLTQPARHNQPSTVRFLRLTCV